MNTHRRRQAKNDVERAIQNEGERACEDGVPFDACPYMGRRNKLAWQRGWRDMQELLIEEQEHA